MTPNKFWHLEVTFPNSDKSAYGDRSDCIHPEFASISNVTYVVVTKLHDIPKLLTKPCFTEFNTRQSTKGVPSTSNKITTTVPWDNSNTEELISAKNSSMHFKKGVNYPFECFGTNTKRLYYIFLWAGLKTNFFVLIIKIFTLYTLPFTANTNYITRKGEQVIHPYSKNRWRLY